MSDALKALKYAESKLGVHEVWEVAQANLKALDELLADLDKALDRRRQLEDEYADREVELVSEKRGTHPSMSDTRFKSEFKAWERTDEVLRGLRVKLNEVKAEIQGIELDVEMTRARLKVGTARMEELGGYLNYLAAVKNQAENAKKNRTESE